MMVLAADPGQTGGIALLMGDHNQQYIHNAMMMPTREFNGKTLFDPRAFNIFMAGIPVVEAAVVEFVSARPGQGVSSMFQFGRMLGALEASVFSRSKSMHYVTPAKWKGNLGLSSDKNASLVMATDIFGAQGQAEWWPLKKHEGVAEAVLLGVYWLRNFS